MSRFVALYRAPEDPVEFERQYREGHLPMLAHTPGLTHVEVSRVRRTVLGEPPVYLMAVMEFPDAETLRAGMASPEWAAAGRNLAQIGGLELATMFILDDPETVPVVAGGSAADQARHNPSISSDGMSTTKESG